MKSRKTELRSGRVRLIIESFENDEPSLHDYGLKRSASWLRAVKFMKHFGSAEALRLIDSRAERAIERGDLATCERWRTLITAIHAVEEDELSLGDRLH